MLSELTDAIKKAAIGAIKASKPVEIMFGEVISINPLEINVEQKMTLSAAHLILSRNVTDYTIEMTVSHWTEYEQEHVHEIEDTYTQGGISKSTDHRHSYSGRKSFTVHNGLVKGDIVILYRTQGGQKFIVVDRIGVT